MDENKPTTHTQYEAPKPPSNSHASIILNGAGNGMMLGTLPFVALELYSHLVSHKPISTQAYKGMAFALVGGCALGTVYGVHEAKQVKNYRDNVSEEIAQLKSRLADANAKLDSWAEKHQAEKHAQAAHTGEHTR